MRSKCEVLLEGEGPWKLPDDSDDFELVFTPGHTAGHVCMYYKPEKVCLGPCLCSNSVPATRQELCRG